LSLFGEEVPGGESASPVSIQRAVHSHRPPQTTRHSREASRATGQGWPRKREAAGGRRWDVGRRRQEAYRSSAWPVKGQRRQVREDKQVPGVRGGGRG
jgi:hypothetical protein